MRGVTFLLNTLDPDLKISTHTPHARRDPMKHVKKYLNPQFQLTRLMRGVTR